MKVLERRFIFASKSVLRHINLWHLKQIILACYRSEGFLCRFLPIFNVTSTQSSVDYSRNNGC